MTTKDINMIRGNSSVVQKEIKLRKVFWTIMIIFLAAGLLGLFGDGVLSRKIVEESNFSIEYDRFVRKGHAAQIQIRVQHPGDATTVSLNKKYVEEVKIENTVPQPQSVEARADRLLYTFDAADDGFITFYLKHPKTGSKELKITVQGKENHLNQFVYY